MGQKKNITFSDIAKYTNFSKTTISRYFNNPDSLTLENQEIISNALTALNYKKTQSPGFLQTEEVNLWEFLYQICFMIIIPKY